MLVKPKPKPEPKKETPPPTSTTADEPATGTSTETPAASEPTAVPTSTATTETPAVNPVAESAPAVAPPTPAAPANPFSDELLSNITAMGFPRDQAIAALRAAFGNPDRAVEYLMNGIPENLQAAPVAPTPVAASAAAAAAAAAPPTGGVNTGGGLEPSALERIRNEPQFQQIRQIIRTNPHLLQQFIQQMSRDNPDLFRDVFAHQEEFIRMLNEPDDAAPAAADASGTPTGPNITREQDGRVTLQVTENERQAIDRLKQLGFPEDQVIQAYFACDKNEELAANFLLSNAFD
jgi:UV excision repair protein RAD23